MEQRQIDGARGSSENMSALEVTIRYPRMWGIIGLFWVLPVFVVLVLLFTAFAVFFCRERVRRWVPIFSVRSSWSCSRGSFASSFAIEKVFLRLFASHRRN